MKPAREKENGTLLDRTLQKYIDSFRHYWYSVKHIRDAEPREW